MCKKTSAFVAIFFFANTCGTELSSIKKDDIDIAVGIFKEVSGIILSKSKTDGRGFWNIAASALNRDEGSGIWDAAQTAKDTLISLRSWALEGGSSFFLGGTSDKKAGEKNDHDHGQSAANTAHVASEDAREVKIGLAETTGIAIAVDKAKELLVHKGAEEVIDRGAEQGANVLEKALEGSGHGGLEGVGGHKALAAKTNAVGAKSATLKVSAVKAKAASGIVKGSAVAAKTTAVANVGAIKVLEGLALKTLEFITHYLPQIGAIIIATTFAFKTIKFLYDAMFFYIYDQKSGKITLKKEGQDPKFIDSHMFSNNDAEVDHYGTNTPEKDVNPDVSLDIHFESLRVGDHSPLLIADVYFKDPTKVDANCDKIIDILFGVLKAVADQKYKEKKEESDDFWRQKERAANYVNELGAKAYSAVRTGARTIVSVATQRALQDNDRYDTNKYKDAAGNEFDTEKDHLIMSTCIFFLESLAKAIDSHVPDFSDYSQVVQLEKFAETQKSDSEIAHRFTALQNAKSNVKWTVSDGFKKYVVGTVSSVANYIYDKAGNQIIRKKRTMDTPLTKDEAALYVKTCVIKLKERFEKLGHLKTSHAMSPQDKEFYEKYEDLKEYADKAQSLPYFYTTDVLDPSKKLTEPALIRFPGGLAGSMRVLIEPSETIGQGKMYFISPYDEYAFKNSSDELLLYDFIQLGQMAAKANVPVKPTMTEGEDKNLTPANKIFLYRERDIDKVPGVNAAFDLQKVFLNTLSPQRYADVFVKAFELGYALKEYAPVKHADSARTLVLANTSL